MLNGSVKYFGCGSRMGQVEHTQVAMSAFIEFTSAAPSGPDIAYEFIFFCV